MKILFLFITGFLLISGCQFDNKWNCFGASSPTDLEIKNPIDKKIHIILFVYSKENGYKKLVDFKIKPKETKVICLENEGPIEDGLYLYYDQRVSKIKLSNIEINKFDLSSELHKIDLTNDLLEAIK